MLHLRGRAHGVRRTHRAGSYTLKPRFGPSALLCLALASCGGGGSGAASTGSYSGASLSVSPSRVSLSSTTSQTSEPTATLQVDINTVSAAPQTYTSVSYSTNGINSVTQTASASAYTLTINFLPPSQLGAGTYDDTVTVSTCYDQKCAHEVSGSPDVIPVTYSIAQAGPTINAVQPAAAVATGPAFTLQVSGSHFTSQSVVQWNGTPLATTFVSSTALTAQVTAADITTPGVVAVTVSSASPGSPDSNAFDFTVSGPTLTAISPASASLGTSEVTLTVTGANFTANSIVEWSGVPLASTFVSPTELTARVPGTDLGVPGSIPVTVVASASDSNGSPPIDFTVEPPAGLTLGSLSPNAVSAGGVSFTLTILGYGFDTDAVAQWNGGARATTYVSPEELLAQISASDIANAGSATVSVLNTSAGITSGSRQVTIDPPSKDAVAVQENPEHSGAVEFNSVILPTRSAWTVNFGGSPSYALIADGKVFVTVDPYTGANESSQLIALDQTTGASAWGPISISGVINAAYDNGTVFVLSAPSSGPQEMRAYDATTGTLKWTTLLIGESSFDSAPTAADGEVFIGGAGGPSGTLYAVDEATGAVNWTESVDGGDGGAAAVTADGVYVIYPCHVYDFRPATGESIWAHSSGCSGGGGATPVVTGGALYVPDFTAGGSGTALNAETGVSEGPYTADTLPAFSSGTGYFLQGGTLRAISASSGSVLWSFAGDGQLDSAPLVVNQYVFIGSSSGNLYALDAATGALVWQQSLGAPIPVGPSAFTVMPFTGLAAGDGLLVVPAGHSVTAYILSTSP